MADNNDYTEGLEHLLSGQLGGTAAPQSPAQDIEESYDGLMDQEPKGFAALIQGGQMQQPDLSRDRIARAEVSQEMAASEYGKLDELSQGIAPEQQVVDPRAVIGSFGQKFERGLKAGWGDLVYGTGDTIDFLSAWTSPGEADPTTSIGSWLKKVGQEYQKDNVLVLSDDLEDMRFGDLFKREFWSSKASRLLPYALSFVVPYGIGASAGRAGAMLLGRYGTNSLRLASKAGKVGKMGRFGQSGTGVVGKLAYDAGRMGVTPTKKALQWSGYLGGGITANIAEGAYLSGEAYNEMINETDEQGNLLFTPEEAASHAAGIMADNGKWAAVDVLQYGLLFGGMGKGLVSKLVRNPAQPVTYKNSITALTGMMMSKVIPQLPAVATYATIEGLTEGMQETYQEWIKYTAIQEAKGQDYEWITDWIKDGDEVRPEIRDIFWSSVGLGVAMGGTRGYFDAVAERTKLYNEKIENVNNALNLHKDQNTPANIYNSEKYMQDNLLAHQLWNYYGDGSGLKSYINQQVKDGKMPQDVADAHTAAIEESEKNYEKHAVNTGLTEAGAKQAYFKETRKQRNKIQQEEELSAFDELKRKKAENIQDETKLQDALAPDLAYHEEVMSILKKEEETLNNEIEFIYTRKKDDAPTAKSTGKRDARYKIKGMSEKEFTEFTQEGAKEKERVEKKEWTKEEREQKLYELSESNMEFAEWKASMEERHGKGHLNQFDNAFVNAAIKKEVSPSVLEQVKELGGKAVEAVKKYGKKAGTAVKKQYEKIRPSEETKKDKADIESKDATTSAKKLMIESYENETLTKEEIDAIKGSGRDNKINRKDVSLAIKKKERVAPKEEKQETEEEVKKKDKSQIIPKTKEYESTEKAIKEKGEPLSLDDSSISKVTGPDSGDFSYMLKTATGKVIRFFTPTVLGAEQFTKTPQNVRLRLVEPIAGKADVVEVDGKLYFQFKKGAPLYESKIEVLIGDELIGELEQAAKEFYEDKGPIKKPKKINKSKTLKKVFEGIKKSKEAINKHLSSTFKGAEEDVSSFLEDRNLEYHFDSGLGSYSLTQSIVQKNFPGSRGFVVSTKLMDDYGQAATALAIGSVVMINEKGVEQTDLIHELGHVYYAMQKDTDLMKRVNKLLYKTELFKRTKREYPELTLFNYNKQKMTLGHIYKQLLYNINNDISVDSDIKSIVQELYKVEGKDNARMNELFNSLRLQLKSGGVKEVRINLQEHLLEETFTRTLENNSKGTIDTIIKGSAAQKQLKEDLVEFYKKTKKLATDKEAKRLLDLTVDNISSLTLDAAIKHILLDFNSGSRTTPKVKNSAHGAIKKASKDQKRRFTGHSVVYALVGDYIGRNLTTDEIVRKVMNDIKKDSRLTDEEIYDIRDYVRALVTQRTMSRAIKSADERLDKAISEIGISIVSENVIEESESIKHDEDNKMIALPKTASHFIRKITTLWNHQNEDLLLNQRKLMGELMAISKNNMYDPYDFFFDLRKSDSHEIKSMLTVLDSVYQNKDLTNAKLMELKASLEGTQVEELMNSVLLVDKEGNQFWRKYRNTSGTIEAEAIENIVNTLKENETEVVKELETIYNSHFRKSNPKDIMEMNISTERILDTILNKSNKGLLVNKQVLLNTPILYDGKNQFLRDILFGHHMTKYGPELNNREFMYYDSKNKKFTTKLSIKNKQGKRVTLKSFAFTGDMKGVREIIIEGLVKSRSTNYLSMVDSVDGDGVSVFNKENGLHNRIKNVTKELTENTVDKNDIMHSDNNIYSLIIEQKYKNDKLTNQKGEIVTNPLGLTVQSGLMRSLLETVEGVKWEDRAAKMTKLTASELTINDFFVFLSRYNDGIKNKNKMIMYDQPIAVFADKSRRYYIESIAAHSQEMQNILLSRVKKNPAYNAKYTNNKDKVFPYEIIEDSKGNYSIKDIKERVAEFKKYRSDNKELFDKNTELNKVDNLDKAFETYITSYIANRFMAQQLFVHDHRMSKNEIDYTKRAAGAIASHTVYDRNIMIEPIIIKDYYSDKAGNIYTEDEIKKGMDVSIENDSMGYILPEQAEAIQAKYGDIQKVGSVLKFVYHYTETKNPNLRNKTTYLKFAVHVLTPTMEKESKHFKNIGNILRERHKVVSNAVNADFDGNNIFSHGNIIVAASESAAKLFLDYDNVRNKSHIHDIRPIAESGMRILEKDYDDSIKVGTNAMNEIMTKQDELYMVGEENEELRKYQGLSGEGFGIQLELDKQSNERFFPSQLFYNLATNIGENEKKVLNRMYELRRLVMEANNKDRNKGLIEGVATEEQLLKEKELFKNSVSEDVFGVLAASMFNHTDSRYPDMNKMYNSIATGRITHKGTKMYTKGSIAYQSSSLGMGLESYQKVSDYFDDDGSYRLESKTPEGKKFRYEIEKLMFGTKDIEAKPNTLISEAFVPEYLRKQNINIGSLFIGTRIPAHGKGLSSVFIVKGFHEKMKGTPTSNITIPAEVSKYWGADLDGDSVHMNFKWTDKEVKDESWREWSNEFFDHYMGIVSNSKRDSEIKADVTGFETAAKNAIKASAVKEEKRHSQLTPMGDSQMFEDNVPAKALVGMVASLQRTFNILASNDEKLPVNITINGNKHTEGKPITTMFDNPSLENGGNWFGVAQLLNIVLDNAKHQFASKLGLNNQSVFSYTLLRRLGYTLEEVATLFNSPIVKEYMEFKRNRSTQYISKKNDIDAMFSGSEATKFNELVEFLKSKGYKTLTIGKKYNTKTWAKISERIKSGINIDLNELQKGETTNGLDAIMLIYTLEHFNNDVVRPVGKAFTLHQSIEKDPHKLKEDYDKLVNIINNPIVINEKTNGGLNIDYKLGDTSYNQIVKHSEGIWENLLKRAERADIRYTPFMQDVYTAVKKNADKKNADKVFNYAIALNLKNRLSQITSEKSRNQLISEFENLQKLNPNNILLTKVLEVRDRKSGKVITINTVEINDYTSVKKISQIRELFNKLNPDAKNLLLEIEAEFAGFGLKDKSIAAFFSKEYMSEINTEIQRIVEEDQTHKVEDAKKLAEDALDKYENPRDSKNIEQEITDKSKHDRNIIIGIKKAKKVIGPHISYGSEHLSRDFNRLTFSQWNTDKGIDITKIDEDSDTYSILQNRYRGYLNDLSLVEQFAEYIDTVKSLEDFTIKELYDKAMQLRAMDNSATKGLAIELERQIGQRAFQHQSEFLRDVGASKGYTYNIPGEDGIPQEDISNFRKWLGSNNMTSKRPEIQYLINEAEKQYTNYIRRFKEYKNEIERVHDKLVKSKQAKISLYERVKQSLKLRDKYRYLYGNIIVIENDTIRLKDEVEITEVWDNLSTEEQEYYTIYRAYVSLFNEIHNLNGANFAMETLPKYQMGELERMDQSGLFGLYDIAIDSFDYDRVKVYGTDKNNKRALKTFYEWKHDVYKNRTKKITLDSGKEIYELDKLRRKAKELKAKGIHEDKSKIILSDVEYDALVNNGSILKKMIADRGDIAADIDVDIIQEYERRQGVKTDLASFDINTSLIEFVRGSLFKHGDIGVSDEGGFAGMGNLAILTDSIIKFNKDHDNPNAAEYLTKWWKEGFLEKKRQEGPFGKTGDKVIDGFVRLTSLRLLGFNLTVGLGNILAGKYQELRKRGGDQFIKGETRFWKHFQKSKEILKTHRVIEYSFDDFIHLSEKKGLWGKIEKYSFMFMEQSEHYIQGSAFLGMLTNEEFKSGVVSDERVRYINHKIITLHGEGYTSLDASLLSMYSYGRAVLQFKKWFITILGDRFKAEDIDRFGEVNIGSYRAAGTFGNDIVRRYMKGDISAKELVEIFNNTSERRQNEIKSVLRGLGLAVTLISLIAMLEDDDDPDEMTIKYLKRLQHDIFAPTDIDRMIKYRILPSTLNTVQNVNQMIGEVARGDKMKRRSNYGEKGSAKAMNTLRTKILPFSEVRKDIRNIMEPGSGYKKSQTPSIR